MARRVHWQLAVVAPVVCMGCSFILGSGAVNAASGDRIGDAVTITNVVMADFAEKQRKLAVGDDVRQDETIEVNTDARGELKLDDDTKLALGAGSRLVLDKFVYDSDKKTGSIVLNLAKGAFRFITGVASKPTYVINTPNASITVRGTIFDAYILPDKSVWLLLHEGAIEATGAKNVCRVLDQPGQLLRISEDGEVGDPVNWFKLPERRQVDFNTAFPFVVNAPTIEPKPKLTRNEIVDGDFPPSSAKPCSNPRGADIRKADIEAPPPPAPPPPPPSPPVQYKPKYVQKPVKPKPTRTAKAKRYNDEDVGAGGISGMDIIIGGGLGGFGRHRGGGDYGGGGGFGGRRGY